MNAKTIRAVGACAVALAGMWIPVACTGEDPVIFPQNDAATGSDAPGVAIECTVDDECLAKLPQTTPADCAVASCDSVAHRCQFKAKDRDGDGHLAKNCSGASASIEVGDDCDDDDPNSFPGAWDGPATEADAGPEARADRCDQRDNDCNGTPDDGKLTVDAGEKTCKCDPGAPLPCYEYENGAPIDVATLDLNNQPKGACKKGTRTCPGGVPGACVGAVGPSAEQCDALDHDCDGVSGEGGDTVTDAPTWYKDSDNDNFGDLNTAAVKQCTAPTAAWKQSLQNTDCDDGDNQRNPSLGEACDGKDNNCNSVVDDGYGINGSCVAGTNGVCKRTGTTQCATSSTTTCSPGPGTSSGEHTVASTDALIYTGNNSNSYTAAWDWNCNGVIDARPDGLINYNYASPGVASSLCSGNYQAACQAAGSTESTCLPVVYACGQPCGTSCTKNQACGKTLRVAYCLWGFNGGNTCDTYNNANDKLMNCQ